MNKFHLFKNPEELLRKAAYEGDEKTVTRLLHESEVAVNEPGKVKHFKKSRFLPGVKLATKETALAYALMKGSTAKDSTPYLNIALALIHAGADVTFQSPSTNRTALHYVVDFEDSEQQKEVARLLIEKGADVNSQATYRITDNVHAQLTFLTPLELAERNQSSLLPLFNEVANQPQISTRP